MHDSETSVLPPHSLAVAAFSTIVEWYDFTLYLYFASVLSRVFYGGGSGSLLLTLGGFAIAYLMRPLGALFFTAFLLNIAGMALLGMGLIISFPVSLLAIAGFYRSLQPAAI